MGFFESLNESLKTGFFKQKRPEMMPIIQQQTVDRYLTHGEENYSNTVFWFDGLPSSTTSAFSDKSALEQLLEKQANLITTYRKVSSYSDVQAGIDEIINEFLFTAAKDDPIQVQFDDSAEVSDSIKEAFAEALKSVLRLLNFEENSYTMVQSWFIDGQLNIQVEYHKNLNRGIKSLNILSPYYLYFDKNDNKWKYFQIRENKFFIFNQQDLNEITFLPEEVIRLDSGLFDQGVIRSNLHNAIKVANMLESLEDMLVPMRFSHSVSRRVFNMDISGLPAAKAQQAALEMQNKFRYKKVYDPSTGSITNTSAVNAIVEDYWVMSRDGNKGLDVQTLDETGNLGEMNDIKYIREKLYLAMKVPLSRMNVDTSADYDFGSMTVSRDEIKFFSYISRLRRQFNKLFIELMKRQLVSQGKMKESEFEKFKGQFKLIYSKENSFLDKLETESFKEKIDTYSTVEPLIGKKFSELWVNKNILKMTDEEIRQMRTEIDQEAAERKKREAENSGGSSDEEENDEEY